MSQNATWIILGWTAIGAATASVMGPISTKYLAGHSTQPSRAATRAGFDRAPRPPPIPGLVVGQIVTTAVLFGLLAWRFGPRLELLAYSHLAATTVPLTVIDTITLRLPRQLVLPLYPTCLVLFGLTAAANHDGPRLARAMTGMTVLLVAYLATAALSHGGLGAGDVRAAGPIGLALTWLGWSTLLTGTLFSLLCATATAVVARNTTASLQRREFPFGPAMFTGTFLAILTQ